MMSDNKKRPSFQKRKRTRNWCNKLKNLKDGQQEEIETVAPKKNQKLGNELQLQEKNKEINATLDNEISTDENKELTGKVCEIEGTSAQFLEENMLQEKENEQKLKENSFNSNIANLHNESEDHVIRIKNLLSQNEDLASTVQDKQTELDSLKLDHENMQTEVGQLKTCNEKLLKDLDEVRAEKKGLLDSTSDLFNSIKKLEDENKELTGKVCEIERTCAQFLEEKKSVETMLQEKENEQKLKENSFNSNIANFQNEIDGHLIRMKNLLSQNEDLALTVQDKQTVLDSLKLDHENMQTEVEQLKTCNNEFKVTQVKILKDLDEVRAENKGLLDSKRDLFNSKKKLEQEKDDLTTKLGNADKEIKGLRQESKNLREQLAKETSILKKQIRSLKAHEVSEQEVEREHMLQMMGTMQKQIHLKSKEIKKITMEKSASTSKDAEKRDLQKRRSRRLQTAKKVEEETAWEKLKMPEDTEAFVLVLSD